jgi:hypothetical protein
MPGCYVAGSRAQLWSVRNLRILKEMERVPMTVVETGRFLKDAARLMPEPARIELVEFVATNPQAGDLISGTGGVRKLRWALPGRGKRGGARVIYYFHSERLPVFLLAAYGKNEKANFSKAERNEMARLVSMLVEGYSSGPRRSE